MLGWVITGLVMWWQVAGVRRWGWVAVLSGVGSAAVFLSRL
jgi:hypothetical protein